MKFPKQKTSSYFQSIGLRPQDTRSRLLSCSIRNKATTIVHKRKFKSTTRLCKDDANMQNSIAEGTDVWLPKNCGFIGGGQMADALLTGFITEKVFNKQNVVVTDICQDRLDYMEKKFGVIVTGDNVKMLNELKIIILAVKPQVMDTVLKEIAPSLNDEHLVVSIAAGYSLGQMENFLGSDIRLVRVMPNTPSKIGAGASGYSLGNRATKEDSETVKMLMDSVGLSYEVTEKQLDAVTGVSGSGPAYVFMLIEAMADGGVRMGLSRDIALKLAAQTVFGSAKQCIESGMHPAVLKDAVTSPGGTTIDAVHKLEELGFRNAVISAVKEATDKSVALSKPKD